MLTPAPYWPLTVDGGSGKPERMLHAHFELLLPAVRTSASAVNLTLKLAVPTEAPTSCPPQSPQVKNRT